MHPVEIHMMTSTTNRKTSHGDIEDEEETPENTKELIRFLEFENQLLKAYLQVQ